MNEEIDTMHSRLVLHPMYSRLTTIDELKVFMEGHVFAVWDFMSLLKSLQNQLTTLSLPWVPPKTPRNITRMINEIVLGEESDLDKNGKAISHFELYLEAMREIGANTTSIDNLLKNGGLSLLPEDIKNFVSHHITLATEGAVEEVASSFFFGRERLIPDMFSSILNMLKERHSECHALIYYFERHIEVDGESHSHLAKECLEFTCGTDKRKWAKAYEAGIKSLYLREKLWDGVLQRMSTVTSTRPLEGLC